VQRQIANRDGNPLGGEGASQQGIHAIRGKSYLNYPQYPQRFAIAPPAL
jgi:hypothetical protein